jgi:hypothetical protein
LYEEGEEDKTIVITQLGFDTLIRLINCPLRGASIMDKLESFKDLKYHEDILYVLGLIKEQKSRKPTETIEKMSKCMTDIAFYVNHLQLTRENYGAIVRDLHTKNLRLQDEIRELKDKLEGYEGNEVDFNITNKDTEK